MIAYLLLIVPAYSSWVTLCDSEKQTYSSAGNQATECKEDWLAVARTNGTNVEKFCAEKCSDYAVRNQQKVDVLILNGELCENCQKPECEAKRKIIQCKCRQSLYVKIWVRPPTLKRWLLHTMYVQCTSAFLLTFQICILSASGGLFIVLKFIFYFVYKIKKIINQMEDSGESEEKVEEKKPKSVSIGRLGRHLSQKRGDTKSGFSETAKSTNLAWNQLLGFTLFLR